jgi:4,5-dihydroxyphthalate decarboxylase
VIVNQIPEEKSIGSMMLSGELDATLLYLVDPNLVDRSTADLWNHPDISYLFSNREAEGARYYQTTGIYPINHGMVVRRSIVDQEPWVMLNLLTAFQKAAKVADQRRIEHASYHAEAGLIPPEATEALNKPMVVHGISANRKVLETATQYSFEQGLTPKLAKLEDIFGASTMEQ